MNICALFHDIAIQWGELMFNFFHDASVHLLVVQNIFLVKETQLREGFIYFLFYWMDCFKLFICTRKEFVDHLGKWNTNCLFCSWELWFVSLLNMWFWFCYICAEWQKIYFLLILIVFATLSKISEIYLLDVIGIKLDVNCLIEVHKSQFLHP